MVMRLRSLTSGSAAALGVFGALNDSLRGLCALLVRLPRLGVEGEEYGVVAHKQL